MIDMVVYFQSLVAEWSSISTISAGDDRNFRHNQIAE
jgi:hypothetical protein